MPEDYYKIFGDLFFYSKNDDVNLAECKVYNYVDTRLINSNDSLDRLLAYRLIHIAGDTSYNELLHKRLKSSKALINKSEIVSVLVHSNRKEYVSSVFDFLVSFEQKHFLNSFITNFSVEKNTMFKSICWENMDSDDIDRQIIAVRCLAQFKEDPKFQNIITLKLNEWDDKDKIWLVQAMLFQEMFLKPYLIKYRNHPVFGHAVLRALKASKHEEDNAYAKAIENEKSK